MKVSILAFALTTLAVAFAGPTETPAGCKKLSSDADWPTPEQWKNALPQVQPQKQTNGSRHPDYVLRAERYKDVEAAVQFCSRNNIRISIITSGHVGLLARIISTLSAF
jgi:hypothetical protein